MPNGVKCSVSNCSFWAEGNNCGANQISIDIDNHAHANYNEEFGDELGGNHKDYAKESSTTCCHTFKPKG